MRVTGLGKKVAYTIEGHAMNSPSTAEPVITPEILKDHGITPEEYEKILKSLGRTPTHPQYR